MIFIIFIAQTFPVLLTKKIIYVHSQIHRAFPLKKMKCVTNTRTVKPLLSGTLCRCTNSPYSAQDLIRNTALETFPRDVKSLSQRLEYLE